MLDDISEGLTRRSDLAKRCPPVSGRVLAWYRACKFFRMRTLGSAALAFLLLTAACGDDGGGEGSGRGTVEPVEPVEPATNVTGSLREQPVAYRHAFFGFTSGPAGAPGTPVPTEPPRDQLNIVLTNRADYCTRTEAARRQPPGAQDFDHTADSLGFSFQVALDATTTSGSARVAVSADAAVVTVTNMTFELGEPRNSLFVEDANDRTSRLAGDLAIEFVGTANERVGAASGKLVAERCVGLDSRRQ
jgi:hypothetical protein